MKDHIFRKGDIRGIVGQDLFIHEVYAFGRALAVYYQQKSPQCKTIVIGRDGREHSEILQEELVRALVDSGLNVCCLGLCSTPLLYYALYVLPADGGVMITASHNEKEYNGFKICYGKELLDSEALQQIKELYNKKAFVHASQQGSITAQSVLENYCQRLASEFSHLKKSNIAAVIDCVGGAAAVVMPRLIEKMEWSRVQLRNTHIDGTFAYACPDPTKIGALNSLAKEVIGQRADIGFAFDGDGDRLAVVTNRGKSVASGDLLLALYSEEILKKNPGATIVFDSKCSQVVSSLIKQWGGRGVMSATGHTFVKQKMGETGALLAGELSCHFMFKDRYFGCDDATYALLRLLEILYETQNNVHELLDRFPKSYTTGEVRIPCIEEKKEGIVHHVKNFFTHRNNMIITTMDGVRADSDDGWGIVRASNTQPVISFSCESLTSEGFVRIKKEFIQALEEAYKIENIPFQYG